MKKLFLIFYNFFEDYYHLIKIKNFLRGNIFFKKPVIFDIGAHKGKLTNLFYSIYNNALIYCFEPNESLHRHFKTRNKNIILSKLAFGDKNEIKKINIKNLDLTNTFLKENSNSIYLKFKNFVIKNDKRNLKKKVRIITLNKFCKKNKIKKIDILKIATEGHEMKVLKGSIDILRNTNVILVEILDTKKNYLKKFKKINKMLNNLDFKLVTSKNIKSVSVLSGIKASDNLFVKVNK